MTRGKRRNPITLSGRANARATEELEINGTECAAVDALAAAGRITPQQHRAARYLIRDHTARNERYVDALARVSERNQAPLMQMVIDGKTPEAYGRDVMGWKNPVDCRTWAMNALRRALDDVADLYSGRKRAGDKPFPGFAEIDDGDAEY